MFKQNKFTLALALVFLCPLVAQATLKCSDVLATFDNYFAAKNRGCKRSDTKCKDNLAAMKADLVAELGVIKYRTRQDENDTLYPNQQVTENKLSLDDALWIARMLEGEAGGEVSPHKTESADPVYEHAANHASLLVWSIAQFQYTNNMTGFSLGTYMQKYSTVINPMFAYKDKGICTPGSDSRKLYASQCAPGNAAKVAFLRSRGWNSFGYLLRRTASAFVTGCLDNPSPKSNSFWQKNMVIRDNPLDGKLRQVTVCSFGGGGNRFFSQSKILKRRFKGGVKDIRYFDTDKFDGSEVFIERPDGSTSGVMDPPLEKKTCLQGKAATVNPATNAYQKGSSSYTGSATLREYIVPSTNPLHIPK